MSKRFLRQETNRHSRVGKGRKKLQRWKKPKGRDSKMRLSMKSHPPTVSVGYKSQRSLSGKIRGKTPVLVHNSKDLEKVSKDDIVIIAKVGAKKRLEIIKLINEKKIEVLNVKETKNEKTN